MDEYLVGPWVVDNVMASRDKVLEDGEDYAALIYTGPGWGPPFEYTVWSRADGCVEQECRGFGDTIEETMAFADRALVEAFGAKLS